MNQNFNLETFFNSENQKRFCSPASIYWGAGLCEGVLKDLEASAKPTAIFVDRYFRQDWFVKKIMDLPGSFLTVVHSEPTVNLVDEACSHWTSTPPARVIAIGGGSTVDAAKATIAHFHFGTYRGIGIGSNRFIEPTNSNFPEFLAFPTTAGTGAETSRYYVLYNTETKHKIHGKSWRLVANKVFLDPRFMTTADSQLLVQSAFDAFVHLYESFTCRYERSWVNELISLGGITKILSSLKNILEQRENKTEHLLNLQLAATLGGVAISNVRTGHIHEAAGILLEESTMTHPETLFVFLRKGVEQNLDSIRDREEMLIKALRLEGFEYSSLLDVVAFWEWAFKKVGLIDVMIQKSKVLLEKKDLVRSRCFERVFSDKVWVTKENPKPLQEADVFDFIDTSLNRLYENRFS